MDGWVHNLQGAHISLLVDFIWESGINDDSIEVLGVSTGQGSLGEFGVVVL